MTKWQYSAALLWVGLILGASGQAQADTTCTTFNSANGTKGFPGTYVGTVGSAGCQIGILFPNQNSDAAVVNTTSNPSIYEFYFGGGEITIQEELGNNGIGYAVDAELDSLASQTSTSSSGLLASIQIPFSSGPTYVESTVFSGTLAAGYYAIDTYLATGNVTDPDYQVNITDGGPSPVPEPSSILLLGFSLAGLAPFVRRRRA